jgi:hypothetical protein
VTWAPAFAGVTFVVEVVCNYDRPSFLC